VPVEGKTNYRTPDRSKLNITICIAEFTNFRILYDEELSHQLIRVGNPCGESNLIISLYKMLFKKKKKNRE